MSNTGRTAVIAALVLIALPLLWGGMMMGGGMMGPGMMWGSQTSDSWSGWRGIWMMVPGILIIVGIVAALVWSIGSTGTSTASSPSARDILDARYARGEITREQYQEMKNEIRS